MDAKQRKALAVYEMMLTAAVNEETKRGSENVGSKIFIRYTNKVSMQI